MKPVARPRRGNSIHRIWNGQMIVPKVKKGRPGRRVKGKKVWSGGKLVHMKNGQKLQGLPPCENCQGLGICPICRSCKECDGNGVCIDCHGTGKDLIPYEDEK